MQLLDKKYNFIVENSSFDFEILQFSYFFFLTENSFLVLIF